MTEPIQFRVQTKIIDAVFTCERRGPTEFRLKVLLKVYAAVGKTVLLDGEIRETEVPFPFQIEEEAEKYAIEKAHEFKLAVCRYTNSDGLSFSISTE